MKNVEGIKIGGEKKEKEGDRKIGEREKWKR